MEFISDVLGNTQRPVYTSLPINREHLQKVLQSQFPRLDLAAAMAQLDPDEIKALTASSENLGKRVSGWVRVELAVVIQNTNNLPWKDSIEPGATGFVGVGLTNSRTRFGANGQAGLSLNYSPQTLADEGQVVSAQGDRRLSGGEFVLESGTVASKDISR